MTTIRAVVVDDEMMARNRMRRLLTSESRGSIEIVAECVDVDDLLKVARDEHIDVVFLDIEMPGGDGFSALRRWLGPKPLVVFVTAYEAHGVRAFDAGAIDYLMKPVSSRRLQEALARVRKTLGITPSLAEAEGANDRKIPLQLGQRTNLVPEQEILVVEASGNYVEVETDRGRFIVRRTLTAFLEDLTTDRFVRLQRSIVVRRDAITEIRALGSGRYKVGLRGGREIISGRRFQDTVRALLGRGAQRRDASDGMSPG